MPTHFTAVAKRNPGRLAWLVEFRHPLKSDSSNKPGRKTRKGLGTNDHAEASRLEAELTSLLSDESLWSLGARGKAAAKFDPRVVEIFYSEIETIKTSPQQLRDLALPLPDSTAGFSKVVLLGSPGAGKTTLLRQLLGTEPTQERFPSTSVNRTTTFPLEIVTSQDSFSAAVTFMSEHEVRFEIGDCVSAAILDAIYYGRKEVTQTFLEKSDMRFRLKYLLGPGGESASEEYDLYDEDEDHEPQFDMPANNPEALRLAVNDYVDRIFSLAARLRTHVEEAQGPLDSLSSEDKSAALDLVEEQAQEDDSFIDLISDILETIRARFADVKVGKFQKSNSGWARTWSLSLPSERRAEFFQSLKYFSGIAKPSWGTLLTPVVNGMRVSGPFNPIWAAQETKLILYDTEGLGHKADASADLPEQMLPMLSDADAILLVDSAKSGMNIAAGKALEAIVNAGHTKKTCVVFTHMDAVRGDNLSGNAKFDHVFNGLRNVVENQVAKNVSQEAARYLMDCLRVNTFYVGKIQLLDPTPAKPQLQKLLQHLAASRASVFIPFAVPQYNPDNMVLAIQKAVGAFRNNWRAYLGVVNDPSLKVKPWQTIKAMSRRYAEQFDDGFDPRPTSELVKELSAAFSQLLETPISWSTAPTMEQRREAIDFLKTSITNALPTFSGTRLRTNPHPRWVEAYLLSGFGSTFTRRMRIEELFQSVLPVPDVIGDIEVSKLINELKAIVFEAIRELEQKSAEPHSQERSS